MGFWIFMFIMNLLIPFTMIGFGRLFKKKSPNKINHTFGYRTTMSMKNEDTWKFAHQYCGTIWFKVGWIMLVLTVIAMLFLIGRDMDFVGNWGGAITMIQCVFLIGSIFSTERALKRTFDKDGKRKTDCM